MNSRKEHELRRVLMTRIEKKLLGDTFALSQWAADEIDRMEAGARNRPGRPQKAQWRHATKTLEKAAKTARRLLRLLPVIVILAGCAAQRTAVSKPKPQLALFRPLAPTGPSPQDQTNAAPPVDHPPIPWEYAPGSNSFCWTLQASTNLVDWSDQPSGCLTGELRAAATNAMMFFRLKGTPFSTTLSAMPAVRLER